MVIVHCPCGLLEVVSGPCLLYRGDNSEEAIETVLSYRLLGGGYGALEHINEVGLDGYEVAIITNGIVALLPLGIGHRVIYSSVHEDGRVEGGRAGDLTVRRELIRIDGA